MYHTPKLGGRKVTNSASRAAVADAFWGASRRRELGRWRVERAGSLTGGYGDGWVVSGPGVAAVYPTWREAWTAATTTAHAQATTSRW